MGQTLVSIKAPDDHAAAFVGDPAQLLGPVAKAIHGEGERILREDVCSRSDDGQARPRCPNASESIIASNDWLTKTETAS